MDDEHGDMGPATSAVSEPTVRDTVQNETLTENLECENQIDGSFREEDGGEVMVEVVGSDVFVDGVSDLKDDDLGSGEVGELRYGTVDDGNEAGMQDFQEFKDASTQGAEDKVWDGAGAENKNEGSEGAETTVKESEGEGSSLSGPRHIAETVEVSVSETVDGGTRPISVSGSQGDDDAWSPVDEVLMENAAIRVREEVSKDEASDKNIANNATRELLDHPVEVPVGKEDVSVPKEGMLHSGDNVPNDDTLPTTSVSSQETINAAPISEDLQLEVLPQDPNLEVSNKDDGNYKSLGDSGSVHASSEHLIENIQMESSCNVSASAHGAQVVGEDVLPSEKCVGGALIDRLGDVEDQELRSTTIAGSIKNGDSFEESKDLVQKPDVVVSDIKDESPDCLKDLDSINCGISKENISIQLGGTEFIHGQSFVSEKAEGEITNMDVKRALDVKAEGSGNQQDMACPTNNKILENDWNFERDTAYGHKEPSNEPTESVNGGDNTVINEEKLVKVKCLTGTMDSQVTSTGLKVNDSNTTDLTFPGDPELLHTYSDMHTDQPLVRTTEDEVINNQKVASSAEEVLGRDAFIQEDEKEMVSEVPLQSLYECSGSVKILTSNTPDEGMHLSAEGEESQTEITCGQMAENDAMVNDSAAGVEVGVSNFVGESRPIEDEKQEITVQITEQFASGIDNDEIMNAAVDNVTSDGASAEAVSQDAIMTGLEAAGPSPFCSQSNSGCLLPGANEKSEIPTAADNISLVDGNLTEAVRVSDMVSNDGVNQAIEVENGSSNLTGDDVVEFHVSEPEFMDEQQEREDNEYHEVEEVDYEELIMETGEHSSETDQSKILDEELLSPINSNRPRYQWLPENEGQLSVSDLVWGKVRSHPWWPGQIFDPADASEKAMKYYKKDCFLVAYFGDRTFAWNDISVLKPFRSHFSLIEKQTNSEAFQNAVDSALQEVSRRLELGLACPCLPKQAHDKINVQIIENTGIREESSRRYGVDRSTKANSFEPAKLLDFVRELAPTASHGADRLDLVIVQAQLLAYRHFKGHRTQTEIVFSEELFENDAKTQPSDVMDDSLGKAASYKRKDTPMDSLQPRKKERSFREIMGDIPYSLDVEGESDLNDSSISVTSPSSRKRKMPDSLGEIIHSGKVSATLSTTPKPSFKIGECIRRVASQLTGPLSSSSKGNIEQTSTDSVPQIKENHEEGSTVVPAELSSLDEMLSQLQLAAQDPKNGHSYLKSNVTFFSGFRSLIAMNRRVRKKKASDGTGEFEFDDANDSYWTDRIVQNYSGEQLLQAMENGEGQHPPVPYDPEKHQKSGRRPNSRKRYSRGNNVTAPEESNDNVNKKKQESLPTELVLNFAERDSLPSEMNLSRIFKRFGPLLESKTEVDRDSGRAKVIFKRGSDAEVAFSSAGKFNIFGPVLVNYQLVQSPAISVQSMPVAVYQGQDDAN